MIAIGDGGSGDSDELENDIIVDPGGISVDSTSSNDGADAGGGSGCFVDNAGFDFNTQL